MSQVLLLVALAGLATAIAVLLERGGRAGYGWIAGSEFALVGLLLGPIALDAMTFDLVTGLRAAVWAGTAWLGLRFGMRLRRPLLRPVSAGSLWASQLEALVTMLALWAGLKLLAAKGVLPLDDGVSWAIAVVGASTTKSATAWARTRLRARGPTLDALETASALDDLPGVVAIAVLTPRLHPVATRLPSLPGCALLASAGIGIALGLLILLLTAGKRFRGELGWVAMFGACAVASGLSATLGLSAIAITTLAGCFVGCLSKRAEEIDLLTRATERPVVLALLVLGGASLTGGASLIAIGVAAAAVRALSKILGGALASPLLPRPARRASFGLGLLGSGGFAFALAISVADGLSLPHHDAIVASALAMTLLGDLVGSGLLRGVLERADELPRGPHAVEGAT